MTVRFVVIAEDELGYRLVSDLCDRVVMERGAPWLQDLWRDEETRSSQRAWRGFQANQRWSSRGDVKRIAERLSIRAHGRGMKAERAMAHKAVAIAAKLSAEVEAEKTDALFLVHDTDGDENVSAVMRDGARGEGEDAPGFPVITAAPHPESEAWVIAGAAPRSHEERTVHEGERQRLGFDPVTHPGQLSSNRETDKRDAKRVCEALLGPAGEAYERWERCWMETPLDKLEHHADGAGLRDYTRQVELRILSILGDQAPR
jgi:hypothetical protein